MPVKNSFPQTVGDSGVNTVDLNALDSNIKAKAKANVPYNLPFGPLVKELFEQSQ